MARNTLVANFFGGPGAGKSSVAAGLFTMLKLSGVNAELVVEYAKEKTWLGDFETLSCQPYVTAKQMYRIYRVNKKVDVIVTDSPFVLGTVYQGFGCTEAWEQWVLEHYNHYWNLNISLVRSAVPYEASGRKQSLEQAEKLDKDILAVLNKHGVGYDVVEVNGWETIQNIYTRVMELIGRDPVESALVRPLV